MNSVNLSGRLIKDPELKIFENESTLCTFFIANDMHFGAKKKTGAELFLTGRLDQYRCEDEKGKQVYDVSIVVDRFDFGARAAKAEERRRTRVVGTFFDGESFLMLMAARLRNIALKNLGTMKHMNMDLLKEMDMELA